MALKTTKWDVTENLDSEEKIAHYLDAVFEDGDPALIAAAIGDVARARGMTRIAKDAGVSRESLYRALSGDTKPEFATILKVLKAMHLRLTVEPAGEETFAEPRFSA
jgi:probable addiction module antidote protein